MKNKKGGFDFVLIFAIFAGAAILVLAIYGATQFGATGRFRTSTIVARQLDVLTDPFQAGFASATKNHIQFNQDIIIKNSCENFTHLGYNEIFVLVDMDLGEEIYGEGIQIKDKFIFSNEYIQGRKIYSLSKSFNFPFKVSDYLIFFSEDDLYCFSDSPDWFKQDLQSLDFPNVMFENCRGNSNYKQVCFNNQNCDIYVSGGCIGSECETAYDYGTISKQGNLIRYQQDLLLPAIFSDVEIYQCNLDRLFQRTFILSDLYIEKARSLNNKDCINFVSGDLERLKQQIEDNAGLFTLERIRRGLFVNNRQGECRVW